MELRWMIVSGALFSSILAIGCGEVGSDDGTPHGVVRSELAATGPWQLPTQLESTASTYQIDYVGAGDWVGPSGCSGTFTAGADELKQYILQNWSQVSTIGGYSCRAIVGNSSKMSVHATGRALDIHIPLDGTDADNGLGDPIANWLIEHAEEIGIQMVIWDRWLWGTSRTPYSRYYSGSHPHHDHLHVELTPEAGRMETSWFQGSSTQSPTQPSQPSSSGCGTPIGPSGGVIDEQGPCFVAYGPSQYWRRVDGEGVDASLLWTNAFESPNPSNWARWHVNLEQAGTYVVEYHSVSSYAVYDSARYHVRHAGYDDVVHVDQSAGGDGWYEIGTFDFDGAGDEWVVIFDNANGYVPPDQHIIVDAIRLRPPGGTSTSPIPTSRPEDDSSTDDGSTGDGSTDDTTGDDGGSTRPVAPDTGGETTGSGSEGPIGSTQEPPPKEPVTYPSEPAPGEVYDEPANVHSVGATEETSSYPIGIHATGAVCSSAESMPRTRPLILLLGIVILGRLRRLR